MFPFQLSFPELHRVRQEGLEKLVFQAEKAAPLSDPGTRRIAVTICCGTGTVSAPYGIGTLGCQMGTRLSPVLVQNSRPRNNVWEWIHFRD